MMQVPPDLDVSYVWLWLSSPGQPCYRLLSSFTISGGDSACSNCLVKSLLKKKKNHVNYWIRLTCVRLPTGRVTVASGCGTFYIKLKVPILAAKHGSTLEDKLISLQENRDMRKNWLCINLNHRAELDREYNTEMVLMAGAGQCLEVPPWLGPKVPEL